MKALLIVDMQNDFMPGGALGVHKGDEIIPAINQLQEHFSIVIASKDWHPPGHISFASRHGKKPGETIEIEGVIQELWPDHCIQGTFGSQFSSQLHTKKISKIFYKGINSNVDSYSAFFDNAHEHTTGLGEYLKEQGVNEIYIVGLTIDYCVKFSVLDAQKFGIKPYVILDTCRGIDLKSGDVDRAIEMMTQAGARIINSDTLLTSA